MGAEGLSQSTVSIGKELMGSKEGEILTLGYFEKLGCEGQREGSSLRTGGYESSFVCLCLSWEMTMDRAILE